MANINTVFVSGRLTKDCVTDKSKSGTSVCRFTVACDRIPDKQGNKTADFINFTAFKQRADFLGQYGKKGARVFVEGSIRTSNFDDPKTGMKVFRTEFIANNVELVTLGNRQETAVKHEEPASATSEPPVPPLEITQDDLPF